MAKPRRIPEPPTVKPSRLFQREAEVAAADSPGVVRTTISLPPDLKSRMDAVKESVNWSGVAAAAFEAKLKELAARKEPENMEDVVKRLRAAAELEANEEYQAGFEAGQAWAKE